MTKRRPRARIGEGWLSEDAYIFFKWDGTIRTAWAQGKTDAEILDFWTQHRDAILARYLADLRRKGPGWAGRRPRVLFDELEAQYPRRRTGVERWIGPVRSDGGDRTQTEAVFETDLRYLGRLGLLEPWEQAVFEATKKKRRGRTDRGDDAIA